MGKGNLIIIRGLPGAGKTTFGRFLSESIPGARQIEADQFFEITGPYRFDPKRIHDAHEWCRSETYFSMSKEVPVIIVSNTFTRNWEMAPYITLAQRFDYTYTVLTVESGMQSVNALAQRNIHGVPVETITAMEGRWEKFGL